ncbi:MAG: hypothetical protein CMA10_07075 [Euryarchaeota archaeon]|nr:hypothetical protein [Euryarchaeota archaeon]|tara:strand:+ start:887 stop:1342 length:456 start_codon:yes stop_codon:yes gene_type:complete
MEPNNNHQFAVMWVKLLTTVLALVLLSAIPRHRFVSVIADGNCQFRALAQALYGNQEEHTKVRDLVTGELAGRLFSHYQNFMTHSLSYYQQVGTWGDHVTLQAACEVFSVKILVYRRDSGTWNILQPRGTVTRKRPIILYFTPEYHYDLYI